MEGSRKNEKLQVKEGGIKGKSCKGCLYYSSVHKSKERKPLCVGISRTLQVPSHIVGESEVEASKEQRRLTDFKYVCVGYSVHMDSKDKDPSTNPDAGARNPSNPQGKRSELPFCIGIELLVDKRPAAATATATAGQAPGHVPGRAPAHAPAHARKTEDGQPLSQPQPSKPPQQAAEEFLPRQVYGVILCFFTVTRLFTRNANIVASGVLKNVYRVGNYIKANVDDMMYPYRRRPK
ncbi:hypothetical protein C5167_010238 [Papaver somniferum]|uniref:DUF8204 domain-containing protein n=1 Tax=Papaver somniferum TaxID=3469 RepID=A0A4Y7K2Q2_PAPSO|nr:hypothetical protein C5167_010238 [Papaver somniferum]